MLNKGIKKIIVAILLLVGLYFAFILGAKVMLTYLRSKNVDRKAVETELEQAKQEARKLDPEGKRIVITDDLLKAEYKDYYTWKVDSNNFILGIICLGSLAFIVAGVVGFFVMLLSSKFSVRKSIGMLIPVVIIIGGIWLLQKTPLFDLPPKPEEVTCKLSEVEILRKNTKSSSSTDDDGTTTTSVSYYIYFNDENGQEYKFNVTQDTYDSLKVHDTCYIACAVSEDEVVYYRKFDLERLYMLPGT
ncbi:MAG: DUF2500 family protein [Lachnospiraceae bacterium]|nr:DUF2500 family protein [Lachnospiraceae bacterium]